MNSFSSFLILFLLSFVVLVNSSNTNNNNVRPPLRFRSIPSDPIPPLSPSVSSSYIFRIVQFTDLHYGEGEQEQWGPEQDRNTTRVMRSILNNEINGGDGIEGGGNGIDLIVYTGDLITGNNIHSNATDYWYQLIQPALEYSLPWSFVFGNHDDLSDGEGGRREDLMTFDTKFPLSYSKFGPNNIKGVSNYLLNINAPSNDMNMEIKNNNNDNNADNNNDHDKPSSIDDNVWTNLVFFDTGGGQLPETIESNQIDWYLNTTAPYTSLSIPSFVFFHIPIEQYINAYSSKYCIGLNDDGISPVTNSSSIYSTLYNTGAKMITIGHQHGNGWCCQYPHSFNNNNNNNNNKNKSKTALLNEEKKQIIKSVDDDIFSLCFGRHTGYGGYGHWIRGARLIEIHANVYQSEISISWNSYVRLEDGSLIDKYTP